MAPRAPSNKKNKFCAKCGKQADVRWRKEWYCRQCLNPDPTAEYLRAERERANGQWGGMAAESWGKV